jgi:small nuclear ribonucleoprotein G
MSRVSQPELKKVRERRRSISATFADSFFFFLFPFPFLISRRKPTALVLTSQYMDRRVFIHLNAGRQVSGVLRGFDMFLNLVVEQAFEEMGAGERKPIGTTVSLWEGFGESDRGHVGEGESMGRRHTESQ